VLGNQKRPLNTNNLKGKIMPFIATVSKIEFPYKVEQQKVKEHAKEFFLPHFP